MPNYDTAYKLWNACGLGLVYVGNSYEPAWYDGAPNLRHDAHLHYTRMLLEPILLAYGAIAAHGQPREI